MCRISRGACMRDMRGNFGPDLMDRNFNALFQIMKPI